MSVVLPKSENDAERIQRLQELVCLLVYYAGGEVSIPLGTVNMRITLMSNVIDGKITYKAVKVEDQGNK
jgi:hypothetical protein